MFVKPAVKLSHMGRRSGDVITLVRKLLTTVVEDIEVDFNNILLFKLSGRLGETMRLIRDREKWGRGYGGGGVREIIYLSLHCYHQNDFCIKVGSGESHFNVSQLFYCEGQSHKTVSTDHNF